MSSNEVTPTFLKTLSNKFDIEIINILDISSFKLTNLGCICQCINLRYLDISNNDLNSLLGIESLTFLKRLHAANNAITSLDSLKKCHDLEFLDIQGNKIKNLENIYELSSLNNLSYLSLQEYNFTNPNPVCKIQNYRKSILDKLRYLISLDGHRRNWEVIALPETKEEENIKIEYNSSQHWYSKYPMNCDIAFSNVNNCINKNVEDTRQYLKQVENKLTQMIKEI